MSKELERDLGLPSVMAISIGAMVGSGIFILPGLALKMAGPAVILAYLIAALLVVPAALSKSEMATAMPEAGGTYLYIERGMGPLLGTIAGVGTWFSLTFKGALALVGGAPYLILLFDLPVKPVALGAAILLLGINLVGVKQTGRLQVAIVIVMLAALAWLVVGGIPSIDPVRYDNFFSKGYTGILSAAGFVFVSYAGVTKVASIAEEIEDPDRNIPLGMLGSLVFTTLLYLALVFVMIGVAPADDLSGSVVPMAVAAGRTLATPGVIAVVVAAVLALISTANAGILSSSRYPFAMSRDGLVPESLNKVHERFNTPTRAISLTGVVLLAMVAFVPITEIAKLASAFKILVFILINIAVIAFRVSDHEDYNPSFTSPLYPIPQLIGIIGGLVLIPLMGLIPLVGAVVITVASLLWYYAYVLRRGGVDREGAATDAVRRRVGRRALAQTATQIGESNPYRVLVAVTEQTAPETEDTLLAVGAAIARNRNGSMYTVRFDEVPDQMTLEQASTDVTSGDTLFEERMGDWVGEHESQLEYGEVVSHDTKHAIVNRAESLGVDAILLERRGEQLHTPVFGSDISWIKRHAPCDVIEIEDRGYDDITRLAVVSNRGPFDAVKIMIANALASENRAEIDLLFVVDPSASAQQRETIHAYLGELESLCTVPVVTRVIESDDRQKGLKRATNQADFMVIESEREGIWRALAGRPADRIVESIDCTAALVYSIQQHKQGRFQRAIQDRFF